MADADQIECFVIENDKTLVGDPEGYGYIRLGETGRYTVYMIYWLLE